MPTNPSAVYVRRTPGTLSPKPAMNQVLSWRDAYGLRCRLSLGLQQARAGGVHMLLRTMQRLSSPIPPTPGRSTLREMTMLWSLALLILCQVVGELIRSFIGFHVPGTVIGICLLLAGLCGYARWTRTVPSLPAAEALLPYLALFFVAPGASAVMQAGQLARVWPAVALGLIGSTVLTLAVVGHLTQALLGWQDRRSERLTVSARTSEVIP